MRSTPYRLYMQPRDVRYGLLLLVRYTDKEWMIDGQLRDLGALVEALREFARGIGITHNKVIHVVVIDAWKIGA